MEVLYKLPLYWPILLAFCDVDSYTHKVVEKTILTYGHVMSFAIYRNELMTSECVETGDRSI